MNRWAIMLLLAIYPSIAFCQGSPKIKEGDRLFLLEDYYGALTIYRQEYILHPQDTGLLFRLAKTNMETNNYSDALNNLDTLISIDAKSSRAHYEKGRLLNSLKMLKESQAEYSRAIDLKPSGEYYYWRGIADQQLAENDKAANDYKSAIERSFAAAGLFNNYAILLVGRQEYRQAFLYINRALALESNYPAALSARAKIRCLLLDVDSACIDADNSYKMGYTRVFEIPERVCKGSQEVKMKFAADLLMSLSSFGPAITAYTRLIEKEADSSDYFLNRGYCLYRLKEYQQAESDYLKALTLPKACVDLLYEDLSLLYFDQNEFDKSVEYSSKRIAIAPGNHEAYIDRGLANRKLKKYSQAEADFNKSLAIKPDFFRAFGYRAFLYLELGKLEKAREDAERAVTINPEYGYGYMMLGQAKQRLGIGDYCVDFYRAKKYESPEAEAAISLYCK